MVDGSGVWFRRLESVGTEDETSERDLGDYVEGGTWGIGVKSRKKRDDGRSNNATSNFLKGSLTR